MPDHLTLIYISRLAALANLTRSVYSTKETTQVRGDADQQHSKELDRHTIGR